MTGMKFRRCSKSQAVKRYAAVYDCNRASISDAATAFGLIDAKERLSEDEKAMRAAFLIAEAEAKDAISGISTDRRIYLFNLNFGVRIYNWLVQQGFGTWDASEVGTWGRISLYVVPDIVARHSENGISLGRYYGRPTRIWLNTLWWFVHLVMVPDENNRDLCDIEKTVRLMELESQDYLQGLVEHTGSGYRVEFTRAMARELRNFIDENEIPIGKRAIFFREYIKEFQLRANVVDPDIEGTACFLRSFADRVVKKTKEYRKGRKDSQV